MTKHNYIKLYPDDFSKTYVWEEYCDITGTPYTAEYITIKFKGKDVDYGE